MDRRGVLLVVEDEPMLRELLAQFLRSERFDVVEAADGIEGVARYGDSGPFDLILVDLNMPGYNGVEVCRRIRLGDPRQRLMVCSAVISAENASALRDLGVAAQLTKPCHPEVLLAHVLGAIGGPTTGPRPGGPADRLPLAKRGDLGYDEGLVRAPDESRGLTRAGLGTRREGR